MERFTTDNPQDNISAARNLFYIKGKETWVRGGGPEPEYVDVPLYDLVRRIIQTHGLAIDTSNNDIMGDCLYERLFDCVDTVEGVVALLYTAAWAFAELRNRLAAYEDTGLTPDDMPRAAALLRAESPYPDGDSSILSCPHCGSGEYLHNEDGSQNAFCGQCGKKIDWSAEAETSLEKENRPN